MHFHHASLVFFRFVVILLVAVGGLMLSGQGVAETVLAGANVFVSEDGNTAIMPMQTHHVWRTVIWAGILLTVLASAAVAALWWLRRRAASQPLQQLRCVEDGLQEAQVIAGVGSWTRDFATGETYWSPMAKELLMLDPACEDIGHYETFVHPDDLQSVTETIAGAYCRGGAYECDHRVRCHTGVIKHVRLVGRVYLKGRGSNAVFEHGTMQDITLRKQVELQLRESEQRFRALSESMPMALLVVMSGPPGGVRYMNPAAHALFGLALEADLSALALPKHWLSPDSLAQLLGAAAAGQTGAKNEALLRRLDGAMFWAGVQAQSIMFEGETAVLLCIQDISVQRTQLEELEKRATLDPGTGVLNSPSMHEIAIKEFRRALRYSQPVSLCVIGLDQLRAVSEGLGLTASQQLVKQFIELLKDSVRVEDSIGRIGEDEFVMLLVGATREGAQLVADRVRKMAEAEPFELQRQPIRLTVSAGVATMEAPDDRVEDVMARALEGLHHARRMGANCIVVRQRQLAGKEQQVT